jgi:hypothetical protein
MILKLAKLAIIVLKIRLKDVSPQTREDVITKPAYEDRHAAALDPNTHSFATKDIVVCAKYLA